MVILSAMNPTPAETFEEIDASSFCDPYVLVTFLVPIVGLIFGILILHETVSDAALAGMLTICLALALVDGRILTLLPVSVQARLVPVAGGGDEGGRR